MTIYTCSSITTITEKQYVNLKVSKEGCMWRFGGKKGKGEWGAYIMISKNKQNNFKKDKTPQVEMPLKSHRNKAQIPFRNAGPRRTKCKGYYLTFLTVGGCDSNTVWTVSDIPSSSELSLSLTLFPNLSPSTLYVPHVSWFVSYWSGANIIYLSEMLMLGLGNSFQVLTSPLDWGTR